MGARWMVEAAAFAAFALAGCAPAAGAKAPGGGDRAVELAPERSGAPALSITLSAELALKRTKKGEDFDVHYVAPESGDEATAHAVVYVGKRPTSFHGKPDAENVTSEKLTLHGERVEVFSFRTKPSMFHKEAVLKELFAGRAGAAGIVVHLAASGTSREALERLWKQLLTVRAK